MSRLPLVVAKLNDLERERDWYQKEAIKLSQEVKTKEASNKKLLSQLRETRESSKMREVVLEEIAHAAQSRAKDYAAQTT